jgi:hypothetical protein
VILQKTTPIGPDDTLGTVYFDRLFPMGVQAMLEAADLVVPASISEIVQDESQATYEGWFRKAEAQAALGEPRRLRLQRDPRLQSGARRVDHPGRRRAADLRRAQASGADLRRRQRQNRRVVEVSGKSFQVTRRADASKCCARSSATARRWPRVS